ncbi:MAG TPA: hypothetical protein VFE25_00975 [Opitutaceae bacterium]|jgi:hypothetical protein|nr:hypothetical protein [Opitutaceae bacterium]
MKRCLNPALALLAFSAATAACNAVEPVSIAAGADRDYVVQKFGSTGAHARPETYVFAKGSFFDGAKSDASLEDARFMDIARYLGPDLERQKYFPAKMPKEPDLLIVVHWGMTSVEDDATNGQADMDRLMADLQAYNSGLQKTSIKDPGFVNSDLAVLGAKSARAATSLADNAQLTGYLDEFRKAEYESIGLASGMSDEDRQIREDLSSERYFVILMAYDYKSLKDGRRLGAKPKLLWSIHVSISAIGRNFTEALPAMSHLASAYFGQQTDGLLLNIRDVPAGKVEVGTPRTIEDRPQGR